MLDMYHREGIMGDYDEFDNVEDLIRFIDTGKRKKGIKGGSVYGTDKEMSFMRRHHDLPAGL